MRFIVRDNNFYLAEKLVDHLERETPVLPDPFASPLPGRDRRRAHTDAARQAWGAYLFDRGMDYRWTGWQLEAEAYYREALRLDPGHADAWVHLGNIRFDEGRVAEALAHYERGEAAAIERTIGDPAHYTSVFWGDVVSRPYMRALHGKGLCLWRLKRADEARWIFQQMLRLNPNDNQGVRFLLHDLKQGLSWEESVAKEETSSKDPTLERGR
jgi:tetratricopeptide (TPR) repeat protein